MHPDNSTLLAYLDRELAEATLARVALHLAACPRCRQEVEQAGPSVAWLLRKAAEWGAADRAPGGSLPRILAAVQQWKRSPAPPHASAELMRRAAAYLHLYFGSGTASRLTAGATPAPARQTVVSTVGPLFSTFLGRKAADAVLSCLSAPRAT